MLQIRFSGCFIATPKFQVFLIKSVIMVNNVQVFTGIIIDGQGFQIFN